MILQQINQPMGRKRVTLSESGTDSGNFLYSDSTDQLGYFQFLLLESDRNKSFVLNYSDSIGGYRYSGQAQATRGANMIISARPDTLNMNGFFLSVRDPKNGVLPKTTVHVYNSGLLSEQNHEGGVIKTLTTNEFGKVYWLNMPEGNYYLNISKTVDTITYEILEHPFQIKKPVYAK